MQISTSKYCVPDFITILDPAALEEELFYKFFGMTIYYMLYNIKHRYLKIILWVLILLFLPIYIVTNCHVITKRSCHPNEYDRGSLSPKRVFLL